MIILGDEFLIMNALSSKLLVTNAGTVIPPTLIIAISNSTHSILLDDKRKTLSPFFNPNFVREFIILLIFIPIS